MAASIASFNFHDSHLADFTVGPRNEVTIDVVFDPVWEIRGSLKIRFNAIGNMSEVERFFLALKRPSKLAQFVDEIEELSELKKSFAVLRLSNHGLIQIHSEKVTLT